MAETQSLAYPISTKISEIEPAVRTYQAFFLHGDKLLRSRMISPVNRQKFAFQFQWFGLCRNKKEYCYQIDCKDLPYCVNGKVKQNAKDVFLRTVHRVK